MDQRGPGLTSDERRFLLDLARRAVAGQVGAGPTVSEVPDHAPFQRPAAAFVTLRKHGELRGCIGTLRYDRPLWQVVRDMAVRAASADPRFSPVRREELNALTVEVSVLSEPAPLEHVDDLRVGEHGVIVGRGRSSGLLLPQVAPEHGWDALQLLGHTCRKAGLPMDAWRDAETELQVFSAEVFSEDTAA